MHEAQLYDENSFVTLTYDEDSYDIDLVYWHFQDFMKRLRKRAGKARFFMCGEYGEKFLRPHFHACIFGVGFRDRVFFKRTGSGMDIYTSAVLGELWPHGFSSCGDVSFDSAAYVARYVLKKVSKLADEDAYWHCDVRTGELKEVTPEFVHMSLKPGIGAEWFRRFKTDVTTTDKVVVNGVSMKPPRYYDKLLLKCDPVQYEVNEYNRYIQSFSCEVDCTIPRLRARELCTRARLSQKVRNLE